LANFDRNVAAVQAPPSRPTDVGEIREVALQELGVFIPDGQAPGAVVCAVARRGELAGEFFIVAHQAAIWVPRAMTQAPVSVATSTTAAGLKRRL